MLFDLDSIEPTAVDLAAIDAEAPVIAADLALLDAEISVIYAEDHHGGPTALDWRRLRRAQRRALRAAVEVYGRPAAVPLLRDVA